MKKVIFIEKSTIFLEFEKQRVFSRSFDVSQVVSWTFYPKGMTKKNLYIQFCRARRALSNHVKMSKKIIVALPPVHWHFKFLYRKSAEFLKTS